MPTGFLKRIVAWVELRHNETFTFYLLDKVFRGQWILFLQQSSSVECFRLKKEGVQETKGEMLPLENHEVGFGHTLTTITTINIITTITTITTTTTIKFTPCKVEGRLWTEWRGRECPLPRKPPQLYFHTPGQIVLSKATTIFSLEGLSLQVEKLSICLSVCHQLKILNIGRLYHPRP